MTYLIQRKDRRTVGPDAEILSYLNLILHVLHILNLEFRLIVLIGFIFVANGDALENFIVSFMLENTRIYFDMVYNNS